MKNNILIECHDLMLMDVHQMDANYECMYTLYDYLIYQCLGLFEFVTKPKHHRALSFQCAFMLSACSGSDSLASPCARVLVVSCVR